MSTAYDKLQQTHEAVGKYYKHLLRQIVREEMLGNKEAQKQTLECARKAKADMEIYADAMSEYCVMLKNNELKDYDNE